MVARVVIGSAIVSALEALDLEFPKVDAASLEEFKQVRKALLAEDRRVAVKKVAVKKVAAKQGSAKQVSAKKVSAKTAKGE